jgi:aryl-alcohol dehydrogenase-like predicted oxidoreductase
MTLPTTGGDAPRRSVLPAQAGERGPRRMGLGLASLGRPGYLNVGHGQDLGEDRSVAALRTRTFDVLDAAYAAGVRYLDAARSYGRAEEFLGAWLRERRPQDGVVGSKWGYVYTARWQVDADPPEVKHHDADTLRRQLEETHALLGDHLALYQIHSVTPDSGVLDDEAVLRELQGLRRTGVAIGVSVSGPSQPETVDRAVELGCFDAVQATWNLHERSAGDALRRAHEAGMAIIVKEALANGRLGPRTHNAVLEQTARALGATPDAVVLAAALAQPFADIVLSGAATRDALRSNLNAVQLRLPDAVLEELTALEEDSRQYWRIRAGLPWN